MYFDHNATTPLLPTARQAWLDATESLSGIRRALTASESAPRSRSMPREKSWLLSWIAVPSRSSGPPVRRSRTTPSCITSRNRSAVRLRSGFPRPSIPACCRALATTFPASIGSSRLSGRGLSIWTGWKPNCTHRPGAVAVMAANNETGVLQPWREILSLCRRARSAAFL